MIMHKLMGTGKWLACAPCECRLKKKDCGPLKQYCPIQVYKWGTGKLTCLTFNMKVCTVRQMDRWQLDTIQSRNAVS